jgi:hypothetical protein
MLDYRRLAGVVRFLQGTLNHGARQRDLLLTKH